MVTKRYAQTNGFTLVELMIVVSVVALLAAMALPLLLRARMSTNETSALAGLRTIMTAEVQFQTGSFTDADGDNVGDFGPLNGAASLVNPAPGTEPFIDDLLATGIKSGYTYVLNVDNAGAGDEAFTCVARPITYGRTGVRSFYVDESGVVRYETANVVPTANSPPLQS